MTSPIFTRSELFSFQPQEIGKENIPASNIAIISIKEPAVALDVSIPPTIWKQYSLYIIGGALVLIAGGAFAYYQYNKKKKNLLIS